MKTKRRSDWLLRSVALTVGLGVAGCQPKPEYYETFDTAPSGSIADASAKVGQARDEQDGKVKLQDIVLLVAHDADGKAVYVEIDQGSGDPALDQRAVRTALEEMRFPTGAANTVTITVKPKSLPKEKK